MTAPIDYRAIFEAAPDGWIVVSAEGTILEANPMVESLFGWSDDELVGRKIETLIPDAVRDGHERHRERFTANPHNRPMGVGLDLRGQRKDGTTFPVEVSLSPWRAEGKVRVICAIRDVSAYRRLRNFSEGALVATEEERKRIARELHDDTAQRLATLILRVRRLTEELDHDRRRKVFESVRAEIVDAAEAVKRMSRGLRPPELEELGLALAVQAHLRSLAEGNAFDVSLDVDVVDPYLDDTTKLALYRIIQEALSNARRHGGTDRASVRLRRDEDHIVVEVRDEGRGFALGNTTSSEGGGLGLAGMQERATMIGGRLVIEAVPGGGTSVRVSVPIHQPTGHDDG
jgi:PAS domain S-box-containing protein